MSSSILAIANDLNANLTRRRFEDILLSVVRIPLDSSAAFRRLAETITNIPVPFTSWRDCVAAGIHVVRSNVPAYQSIGSRSPRHPGTVGEHNLA